MKYDFKTELVKSKIIKWLKDFKETGCKGVVIGISGGKDSTVAAALCAEAFGPENVLGVLMPNGIQKDIEDSKRVVKALGIKSITINIGETYNSITSQINIGIIAESKRLTNEAAINIAPRLRMTVLYAVAQSMGGGYRVCGTGNFCERTLGYFTKWGDGACDFNPLAALTTVEVVAIGDTFENIPTDLIHKVPDDGLSGMTDEEKLGIKYLDVHKYRRNFKCEEDVLAKIKSMEKNSEHKISSIPIFLPNYTDLYSND